MTVAEPTSLPVLPSLPTVFRARAGVELKEFFRQRESVVFTLMLPMLLLVATTFWHIKKGLREIIDDYAHTESGKVLFSTLLAFFVYFGGALATFCVLKLALGGGAS